MPQRLPVILLTSALLLAACKRPEIRVYTAPKDPPPGAEVPPTPQDNRAAQPRPKLSWKLPAGWTEVPAGQVSAAQFQIASAEGEANVNITPLPNLAGKEALVVNMWREQVGQPPLAQEELAGALKSVDVAGGQGQLFEITGSRDGSETKIVTAMLHKPDASWFFKLAGSQAAVAEQQPAFLKFLKSVKIGEAPATAAAPPKEPPPAFKWKVPEGWQAQPAGQMQVAKFSVPERDGKKAEATVSIFPSDTGGTLANVNRWRGQLGMPQVDDAALAADVKPLDASLPGAVLADLTHDGKRIVGAIVPRDGKWFFYKLMGDSDAVEAEKEALVEFSKSEP